MPMGKLNRGVRTALAGNPLFRLGDLRTRARLLAMMVIVVLAPEVGAKAVVEWDFSKGMHGWTANDRVEKLSFSPDGLVVKSVGEDPWIEGPEVDLPGGEVTRLRIRMKSNADTSGQLFYGRAFSERQSIRFNIRDDGKWHDYKLVIRERLGGRTRFRLDPCAGRGDITIASIKVETIDKITAPLPVRPKRPIKTKNIVPTVESGSLAFHQCGKKWGDFILTVNGVEMAVGYSGGVLGILIEDEPEWLSLDREIAAFGGSPAREQLKAVVVVEDSKGGKWEIERKIRPGKLDGTIVIDTRVRVDRNRDVIHVPWLTIFCGLGTFGERKDQGLLAGVEYLCDEPSSSDADIAKPKNIRRVPDAAKITFPLMAIAYEGSYIGVIWEPSDMVAAVFDSPDRIFNSGGHVMALSAPAVGELRFENEPFAHSPFRLEANKTLKAGAIVIGDKGKTVVPAVKQYVKLKGLPPLPRFEGGFNAAVNLLTHGWLDSAVNQDGLFRHAVWGERFGAGPAADAAMFIDWLANNTSDTELRERLETAREKALGRLPAGEPFSRSIGHAHLPTAPFVFGRLGKFVQWRHSQAVRMLKNFDKNGVKLYRPGKTDYSTTHFAKHANGFSGRDVATILEGAALSGDKELIRKTLLLLDKQTVLYADTVPRGAQTWEVPLHTPDILASAYMVKAYTLAFAISGKKEHLGQARYWAWTGVPFVYLCPVTGGEVGAYATTPVLGATNWKAPNWIGLPVQWCGLVYCSALHLLSEYDAKDFWAIIAKGITTTGLQMSWPVTDEKRQGLLPDFFHLREQSRDGPAINPGTVQAHLAELYGKGRIYDVKKMRTRSWFVHAPCAISDIREEKYGVRFFVEGWGEKPCYLLISGVKKEPAEVLVRRIVRNTREPRPLRTAKKEYDKEYKSLIIMLEGKSEIRIRQK